MTMTRPLRLMTLHFSQMGFTEGLTFIVLGLLYPFLYDPAACPRTLHALFETVGYAATSQVIRCKLDRNLIPRQNANEIHADLT